MKTLFKSEFYRGMSSNVLVSERTSHCGDLGCLTSLRVAPDSGDGHATDRKDQAPFGRDATWAQTACAVQSDRRSAMEGTRMPARRSRAYVIIPKRSMTAVVLEAQQRRPERGKTARWFERGMGQRGYEPDSAKLRVVGWGLGASPLLSGPRTRRSCYALRLLPEAKVQGL